jgi:hypothetical protein
MESTTGYKRSYSVVIRKLLNGEILDGYPKIYPTAIDVSNGYFVLGGTHIPIMTGYELQTFTQSEYNAKIALLKDYVIQQEGMNPFENQFNSNVVYDPENCVPDIVTTTTTEAEVTTTTTELPVTTTTTSEEITTTTTEIETTTTTTVDEIIMISGTSYASNRFYVSKNTINWEGQSVGTETQDINTVDYLNGYWFVGGYMPNGDWEDENGMLISIDGETWTPIGLTVYQVMGVDYNALGTYVAGGAGSNGDIKIMYCTGDPTGVANWNLISDVIFLSEVRHIRYLGNRFWALGGYGVANSNTIAYSSDGITWTPMGKTLFSYKGGDIEYNGSETYIAGGWQNSTHNMAYCTGDPTDIANWTGMGKTLFSTAVYRIIYNGGIWIIGGEGTNSLAYCTGDPTNTENWVGLGSTVFTGHCYDIKFYNGYFYAVGDNPSGYHIQKSSDGINWSNATDIQYMPTLNCIGVK